MQSICTEFQLNSHEEPSVHQGGWSRLQHNFPNKDHTLPFVARTAKISKLDWNSTSPWEIAKIWMMLPNQITYRITLWSPGCQSLALPSFLTYRCINAVQVYIYHFFVEGVFKKLITHIGNILCMEITVYMESIIRWVWYQCVVPPIFYEAHIIIIKI